MPTFRFSLCNILVLAFLTTFSRAQYLKFSDVTLAVGISQPGPQLKWGGPFIADLDNDGYYDMILAHHFSALAQLYFGNPNATFTEYPLFTQRLDIHGIAVGVRRATSASRLIAVSVGGRNGARPSPLYIYQVTPDRIISDVSFKFGFGSGLARSRNTVFMDLANRTTAENIANGGGPDVLALGYLGRRTSGLKQFAYQNRNGFYRYRRVRFLEDVQRGRVEVTDVDGDGVMELINILWFEIYKLDGPFGFRNATAELLPSYVGRYKNTVAAVAEIDFDNDGDFDLYIARTQRSLITKQRDVRGDNLQDLLLENRGGRFVDVTKGSWLPKGVESMGVTVGDFNNDGWADVYVTTGRGQDDFVLINRRNGRFRRVRRVVPREKDVPGNHAVAVDYDMDGRLDVVVGQGGFHNHPGVFRVMHNEMNRGRNRYLLVRVGESPIGGASSLYAVVTVKVGGMSIIRRVGSAGAQVAGGSYLNILHFGLGANGKVDSVHVTWTDGAQRRMVNVDVDTKVVFGQFPSA